MPATASANHRIRRRELRRAWSWAEKKSTTRSAVEAHLDVLARLDVLHLPLLGGTEAEGVGDQPVREGFALDVVRHHRVVVGLTGEGDAVLGAGELLLQLRHVLVGLQVR